MVTRHLIPEDIVANYEVHEWRNATGVLQTAHLNEWQDIIAALRAFQFRRSELLKGGGAKSIIAQRIDNFLMARQWKEKKFATQDTCGRRRVGFANAQGRLLQGTRRPRNRVEQQRSVL